MLVESLGPGFLFQKAAGLYYIIDIVLLIKLCSKQLKVQTELHIVKYYLLFLQVLR